MTVAGILAAAVVLFLMDGPRLVRHHLWKEFWVFLTLLCFGVALMVIQALKIEIASPLYGISAIFRPVTEFIFGLLT
jgi:hypothetical protein